MGRTICQVTGMELWEEGMVERGVKPFKARLAGSGMRWSRSGAERLLPVQAAVMSQCFEQRWPVRCAQL